MTVTFVEEHEGAQIVAQGVGSIEAEEVLFAVTGGTGYYRNARGQATFESRGDGGVITYELDTTNYLVSPSRAVYLRRNLIRSEPGHYRRGM